MRDNTEKAWLALGDSYTIGEAVPMHHRWPHQLTRQLDLATPQYLATTGWTTQDLSSAVQKNSFQPPYTWVSLSIGANNQYQGLDISLYSKEFTELLEFAVAQTTDAQHVLVLSIPDYSVTPYAQDKNPEKIQQELENYNQVNREISSKYGVQYCDVTPISQLAAKDQNLTAEDGLHPSGKMYSLWVEKILEEISLGKVF